MYVQRHCYDYTKSTRVGFTEGLQTSLKYRFQDKTDHFVLESKKFIGGKMIKTDKYYIMTSEELMDMDRELVYLLDMFDIESYKEFIKRREEYLETYLHGGTDELDTQFRINNVKKYFYISTLPKHLRKFIEE